MNDRFFFVFLLCRYGPGAAEAPVQQAKKIRVLPTAANGAVGGTAGVGAVKLRPTDNGLALQKVGTLHIANRKLTELHHNLVTGDDPQSLGKSNIVADLVQQQDGSDETRSPTPDYDPNNKRGRSRNKKKVKAPTAPSTPAASAKSGSSRMDDQPASKSSGRGKLRLFKTKSTDSKSADAESGRIRARSMEYLRADLADETQEVRRRHSSREDLSGDESLLAFTKNGPVTVFSSQKKLNGTADEDWEDMPSLSRNTPPEPQPKQQFYFGMTPGDVAVAAGGPQAPKTAQSLDLDEESRRVMEEFDAVLAESKSIDRKSDTEEKEVVRRRRVVKSTSSSGSSNRRHSSPAPPPPVIRHNSSSGRNHLDEEEEDDQDIALSLRPTLPKKPQQLPRFSPSAAWRALGQSSDHYPRSGSSKLNASSSKASDMSAMDLSDEEDEDEDVMEDRIAKNALRPVAPHPPRISNEKSADSGISGDAGSPDAAMASAGRDKPLAMSSPVPPPQQQQNNWTPQQDLLDDDSNSSSEADVPDGPCPPRHDPSPPKIIPKSQMFNDSMTDSNNPGSRSSSVSKGGRKYRKRNETGGSSRTDEGGQIPQKYNSLRKLKRSVSGAFATAFRRSKSPSDDDCANVAAAADDGNWMLSRSAPNSVINGSVGDTPSIRKFHRSEADLLAQNGQLHIGQLYPAYSQPSVLTQRIVYLPQYDSRIAAHHQRGRPVSMDQAELMRRARSADAVFLESKSLGQRMFGNVGNKKFTFQSTVRVHEKRLLEEKLSREAEQKERKRLQEMQAMQRVEEEFQRKRAREKANIRQQLRVLQLDHYKQQEQLMLLQQQQQHQQQRIARLDPEGAPSSISHHRTSSDELQQQKQSPAKGSGVQKQQSALIRPHPPEQKRKESAAVAPVLLRANRNGSNIRPDDEQPQRRTSKQTEIAQQQQQIQPQMDYRREVISSSRTRSAAPQPAAAGPLMPEVRTNGERNNNNVAQKKSSNIYRRLAEITSEEESIASPPPVPLLVVSSVPSPSRSSIPGMNGNVNKPQHQPSHRSSAAHVISNGAPAAANNKVMTQELSEYRQERREYRDFRSPRHHQQQQLIAAAASPGLGGFWGICSRFLIGLLIFWLNL